MHHFLSLSTPAGGFNEPKSCLLAAKRTELCVKWTMCYFSYYLFMKSNYFVQKFVFQWSVITPSTNWSVPMQSYLSWNLTVKYHMIFLRIWSVYCTGQFNFTNCLWRCEFRWISQVKVSWSATCWYVASAVPVLVNNPLSWTCDVQTLQVPNCSLAIQIEKQPELQRYMLLIQWHKANFCA